MKSYFIGYLLIQNLWNRCVYRGLRPANLLDFLCYYFYEDWVLVQIIVSDDKTAERAVTDSQALRADLLRDDIPRRVQEFEHDKTRREGEHGLLLRGPEERERGGFDGLGLSSNEIASGMQERCLVFMTSE